MTILNNLQNLEEIEKRCSFSVILHLTMQKNILNATIQYIFDIKRFDVPLTNL